jgi:hypothetical protein
MKSMPAHLYLLGAEHDDDDVPLSTDESLVLRASPVRRVANLKQGRAAGAKIGNRVFARILLVKHDLELAWVSMVAARGMDTGSDAVTDRADLDRFGTSTLEALKLHGSLLYTCSGAELSGAHTVREAGNAERRVDGLGDTMGAGGSKNAVGSRGDK